MNASADGRSRSAARSVEPGSAEFLARACHEAADRVAEARRREPLEDLRARALGTPAPAPFGAALTGGVIAEVKRASPSRGVIAADRDANAQARAYLAGGAAAVSVLTEPRHFLGSLVDLHTVASAVRLPVLRKDFVVDAYQVVEARAAGAAAVLLLVAALDHGPLVDLLHVAREVGVEALIETHDADDIARATAAIAEVTWDRAPVVGVNARDLRRLSVDRARVTDLIDLVPDDAVVVAESGVSGPADVAAYVQAGADAVLVGEHLMRADDPEVATHALATAARAAHRARPARAVRSARDTPAMPDPS